MPIRKALRIMSLVTLLSALALPAWAVPILGAKVFVKTTGDVEATFEGNGGASFADYLYLDSPSASGVIFNSQTAVIGDTVNLGSFTAGDELVFRIFVDDTSDEFFTGPAVRNPDGVAHAIVDVDAFGDVNLVGFEDLYGGG